MYNIHCILITIIIYIWLFFVSIFRFVANFLKHGILWIRKIKQKWIESTHFIYECVLFLLKFEKKTFALFWLLNAELLSLSINIQWEHLENYKAIQSFQSHRKFYRIDKLSVHQYMFDKYQFYQYMLEYVNVKVRIRMCDRVLN